MGKLNLANCRGVSDDWLISLTRGSNSMNSGRPVDKTMAAARGSADRRKQRPRSTSAASNNSGYEKPDLGLNHCQSRSASSSPPLRSIHHPTQFVLSPYHSSSFLEVGGSVSSMMADMFDDDYDEFNLGQHSSSSHHHQSRHLLLPSPSQQEQQDQTGDAMEDCCTKSFASCSTCSFVSASSTPYSLTASLSHEQGEEERGGGSEARPPSPLLPSVLPPPEFFSMKLSPSSTPSSLRLHPMQNDASVLATNNAMATSPLFTKVLPALPSPSSLHAEVDDGMDDDPPYDNSFHNNEKYYDDRYYLPSSPITATASTLTLLDLRGSQRLTDRGLLQLSHTPLRSLEVVKLDNCHGITGKGLLAFSRSHKLHTLSLANCRRLTDEAVVNVSHLGMSLTAVNLGGCRCLTDRSLEGLSHLMELRKLDLSQVSISFAHYYG